MDDEINILMVDDDPRKLLSYEAILNELGENLIKAHSGSEALEHLLKNDIAIVLMDVSMPELDGFELAKMIHQHPRFQNTAIIFVSGIRLTDLDRLKGYEHGAVDYISVPVVPDLLKAKVRVFAELYRKSRQLEMLNESIIRLQDEERKRIARELHDSVGQLLAAISMNISFVEAERHRLSPDAARRVTENNQMVEEITRQIRTISHLLHPPLLDEAGLASALRCYVEGFSERSRIDVKLGHAIGTASACRKRLNFPSSGSYRNVLQMFIVIPGAPLRQFASFKRIPVSELKLKITGRAFRGTSNLHLGPRSQTGIGIRGMRERLRQLNGTLEIGSNGCGTRVTATIPIRQSGLASLNSMSREPRPRGLHR